MCYLYFYVVQKILRRRRNISFFLVFSFELLAKNREAAYYLGGIGPKLEFARE